MNIPPLGFYELARASHIKRWHIINTATQQNLAEHQYNVATISLALRVKIRDNGTPPADFVLAALFHDAAEIRYGDIPTPGKQFIKSFVDDPELFDSMDQGILPSIPFSNFGVIDDLDEKIIKLADLIEAAWWIQENGAGAHAKIVASKCRAAVDEYTHSTGWYQPVNQVLVDLGMSPINPHLRATPP